MTVSVQTEPVVVLPSPYWMLSFLLGTAREVVERAGLYLECVLQAAEVQLMEGIQRSAELRKRLR